MTNQPLDVHAPLLDAIAASPRDPTAYAVYADLLQMEGHPRGELISLMLERELRPSPRLYELQKRVIAANASLLDVTDIVTGWRRGFASELRLKDPKQLEIAQTDLTLRFVEGATIVIDDPDVWRLGGAPLPWRRLQIELLNGELDLAVFLSLCPALETLHVMFGSGGTLRFAGAASSTLQLLRLQNVGEVSLGDAKFPALEEVRLVGASTAAADLHGPTIKILSPISDEDDEEEDEYDDQPRDPDTTAFVVVEGSVPRPLIDRLVGQLSIKNLSARIASTSWLPWPLTVIQLFGGVSETDLMPYSFAMALHSVHAARVALVEIDGDRAARYLVLGDNARGSGDGAADVVRRGLDVALGCDAGPMALRELLDALSSAATEVLVGEGGSEKLTMIDPSSAPVAVPEEPEQYEDDDEDYDRESEDYAEYDWDDLAGQYEEPLVVEEEDEPAIPVVIVPIEEGPVIEVAPRVVDEDALAPPPERVELWLDFREHWDDRATDVDDEPEEARWPDPGRTIEDPEHIDRQVAERKCAVHDRALDDCSWCGTLHCTECGGEDLCASCFSTMQLEGLVKPSTLPRE